MSAPTNKRYVIRHVSDLLAVPADRRTACLMEMEVGLMRVDQVHGLIVRRLPHWLRRFVTVRLFLRRFIWIDDGRHDETVTAGGVPVWERKSP